MFWKSLFFKNNNNKSTNVWFSSSEFYVPKLSFNQNRSTWITFETRIIRFSKLCDNCVVQKSGSFWNNNFAGKMLLPTFLPCNIYWFFKAVLQILTCTRSYLLSNKMARALAKNPLLLGYPDEEITEEYLAQVDFCASKIGGKFSNRI